MLMQTPQGLGKPGGDNVTTLESIGSEGTAAKTQVEERTQGEEQKRGAAKKRYGHHPVLLRCFQSMFTST